MARPSLFDARRIESAAARLASRVGPANLSVASLATELGAPTGSIYHRFESKDELLARVWLGAVERFQADLYQASDDGAAGAGLAWHVVAWCSGHHALAKVLNLYRRDEWLGKRLSSETRARVDRLNKPVGAFLRQQAREVFGSLNDHTLSATKFAIVDLPSAAVRDWLRRDVMTPAWVANATELAAAAVIEEARLCA